MRRLIREPLVHFVVIAIAIFAFHGWASDRRAEHDSTIVVTSADLERMASLYASEAGNLPTEQDMRAMVLDHIEQQALTREARRLGLAEGDTVVERRLAQKMSFMITDMEAVSEPSPGELEAWFEQNRALFIEPDRISFQHVFFGQSDDPRIGTVGQNLASTPETWRSLGDPFMLQRAYSELPPREVSRLFGKEFSVRLVQIATDSNGWVGPVPSALGLHFVRVTSLRPGGMPALDAIRSKVQAKWQEEKSREQARAAVQEIVSRYQIEIDGEPLP